MNIIPFYIVCGYVSDFEVWQPLKLFIDNNDAIKFCKKNKFKARFPWQRVFSIFHMEYQNGYYDQEGWHEYK